MLGSLLTNTGVGIRLSNNVVTVPQRQFIIEWIKRKFDKRKYVGKDPYGNKYYTYTIPGSRGYRRCVEFADGRPDPTALHFIWDAWLRGNRPDVPTEEEVQRYDVGLITMREKVRKLEEKDAAMRAEEQRILRETGGSIGSAQYSTETFIAMLERHQRGETDGQAPDRALLSAMRGQPIAVEEVIDVVIPVPEVPAISPPDQYEDYFADVVPEHLNTSTPAGHKNK